MFYKNYNKETETTLNRERLIADEVSRLTRKYGKSALMHSKVFPVTKVGNRQVVSILAFVAWQVNSLPEAV